MLPVKSSLLTGRAPTVGHIASYHCNVIVGCASDTTVQLSRCSRRSLVPVWMDFFFSPISGRMVPYRIGSMAGEFVWQALIKMKRELAVRSSGL